MPIWIVRRSHHDVLIKCLSDQLAVQHGHQNASDAEALFYPILAYGPKADKDAYERDTNRDPVRDEQLHRIVNVRESRVQANGLLRYRRPVERI